MTFSDLLSCRWNNLTFLYSHTHEPLQIAMLTYVSLVISAISIAFSLINWITIGNRASFIDQHVPIYLSIVPLSFWVFSGVFTFLVNNLMAPWTYLTHTEAKVALAFTHFGSFVMDLVIIIIPCGCVFWRIFRALTFFIINASLLGWVI